MRILLLSAYDADSHRYWRQGLVANFPEHSWTVLTLPARYFSWRVRGNSLTWAFGDDADKLNQPYDLVIATSMTDLSSLRGFAPRLAQTPTLLYFHENQFAYPLSGKEHNSVEPQILNLYSALAADQILFNTEFNRKTFLEGARALLKKLPDHIPNGLVERLTARSSVLPVPLDASCYRPHQCKPDSNLQVVWNHRWEFDKGPHLLYQAIEQSVIKELDITFHIVGQQFRNTPAEFKKIASDFGPHLGAFGYVESIDEYRTLLTQADVVLSTALHDYQGVAVLEAVAAGAIPLVPNRLAYPYLFDEPFRYASSENETAALVDKLAVYSQLKAQKNLPPAPNVTSLSWSQQKPHYEKAMEMTLQAFQH